MYEVDFLPVESANGPGSKSGDAIAIHFKLATSGEDMVVVIDGGFTDVGDALAEHIMKWYGTSYVDLVISTHPDADHINGLARLIEHKHINVGELLLHQPMKHHSDVSDFSNIEAVENLLKVANEKGVIVAEPFTGLSRFDGQLMVLGPTPKYYTELVAQHIEEEKRAALAKAAAPGGGVLELARNYRLFAQQYYPSETLTDEGETGPRNNSSVITLLRIDDDRLLFTGDAGIPALEAAADEYESQIGEFNRFRLGFVQVPHHGSRRNVGPTILNRILGTAETPFSSNIPAFISSAKADEKHPSPKVTNAFGRRGCIVCASEGQSISYRPGMQPRPGWYPMQGTPPLSEDDDD